LQQQVAVCAHADAGERLNGVLGCLAGAKQKPHGRHFDRSTEVHLVFYLPQALEIGKEMRDRDFGRPVDHEADRGGPEIVHHEHDRVCEKWIV